MLDATAVLDVAERWVQAMNSRDVRAAEALLSPQVVFWTNTGHDEIERDGRLQLLAIEFEVVPDFSWYDVRYTPFEGGCLAQMRVRGTTSFGSFDTPMCTFLTIDDGQLTRVESYLDPAPLEPLMKALVAYAAERTPAAARG